LLLLLRRSYTGEDGFELSIPNSGMNTIAEALVADPEVRS
jgi:glycine cleavage system aminomethyltransferase T